MVKKKKSKIDFFTYTLTQSINELSPSKSNKIIKDVFTQIICPTCDDITEINTYVNNTNDFVNKYSTTLIKYNIFLPFTKCLLELKIFSKRFYSSTLCSKINLNISEIYLELCNSLNKETEFLTLCLELENNVNGNQTLKYNHINSNIDLLKLLFKQFNKTTKDTKNISLEYLKIIYDILKNQVVKSIYTCETPLIGWKKVIVKLNEYLYNNKPFSIYDLQQKDTVNDIFKNIKKMLCKEHTKYSNKLMDYISEKKLCMDTNNYNKYEYLYIVFTLNKFCNIFYDLSLIDFNEPTLDDLINYSEKIYDSYMSTIDKNITLDINFLQTSDIYKNTHFFDTKWIDICSEVHKYAYFKKPSYFKNIKKYRSIKCSLKSTIKGTNHLLKINKIVFDIDKIRVKTMMFIKMYILYLYDNNESIIDITDIDIISMAVRTVSINDPKGANMSTDNKIILKKMEKFYENTAKHSLGEKCNAIGYSQILSSCKIQLVTAYKNNITMNYIKYLRSYMYSHFEDKYNKEYCLLENCETKKEFKKQLKIQINSFIADVLKGNIEDPKLNDQYKNWFMKNKVNILPTNVPIEGLLKDLENNTNKYFKYMIYMTKESEKIGKHTYNCFPLHSQTSPSNIELDTMSLITLFSQKVKEDDEKVNGITKVLKDNIHVFKNKIWKNVFNLDSKYFKLNKYYKFNSSIQTDGVSITILFVNKMIENIDVRQKKQIDTYMYIDDLGKTDDKTVDKEKLKEEVKKLKDLYELVYLDPGKNPDILYMCNDNNKFMKYTTKQYLNELGTIKNRKTIKQFKKENQIIEETEKNLMKYTSKTCDVEKFGEYCKIKLEANEVLIKYYGQEFIRKMRLRTHINKLRSESKLVNNIKKIFGSGEEKKPIMIIYGDWCRRSQMRGCISVPMIGIKRRLGEDFKIMNLDEFRTSCIDGNTYKENINAEIIDKKTGKMKKLHSVLVSNILKNTESGEVIGKRFQNRNRNAVLNFKRIVDNYQMCGERIKEFDRSTKREKLKTVIETIIEKMIPNKNPDMCKICEVSIDRIKKRTKLCAT
jgi:hypothetical protein